jgi:hypothetical protein
MNTAVRTSFTVTVLSAPHNLQQLSYVLYKYEYYNASLINALNTNINLNYI